MDLGGVVSKTSYHHLVGQSRLFWQHTTIPLPNYRHMSMASVWCPHQAMHLCSNFSVGTLYLASTKRKREADHGVCLESDSC